MIQEIVVLSGKGGTGKTSITASLAFIAKEKAVIADGDVDAADLHLILQPQAIEEEAFYSGVKAEIDYSVCKNCGKCAAICRFGAIQYQEIKYSIDKLECEGCGYCAFICPAKAIRLNETKAGTFFLSETRTGAILSHAELETGADNSGKLVAKVKKEARKTAQYAGIHSILVDGAPGIGCPVISSLSGANYVLLVTEPTLSGLHDLKRVCELARKYIFNLGCIINKADINLSVTETIKKYLKEENIESLITFPYDEDFYHAMTNGVSLVELNPDKWLKPFILIWEKISRKKEEA
jgi:MinD superfamily P-loop ATPase